MKPPRSYDVHQPDFRYDIGNALVIFVDGIEQIGVLRYDIDEGVVERQKCDEDGRPIHADPLLPVESEIIHGSVAVRIAA